MSAASDSILTSVKKVLGLDEAYEAFDLDITMHINSALSTLTQLGIGPELGYMIDDKTDTWNDFLPANDNRLRLNAVRTYVYLRVRLIFDPPATSFVLTALQEQVRELEWRLNVVREHTDWTDPNLEAPLPQTVVLDGGVP